MKTYKELVTWISSNTDSNDPERAALWFIACQEAETLFDGTIKENAHWVMSGIPPLTPQMVTDWLHDAKMMADEDYDACKSFDPNPVHFFLPELMEALRYHFGSSLK